MTAAQELRATPRRTTTREGQIQSNNGKTLMDCVVRNLSGKGAKLQVSTSIGIPDTFLLALPNTLKQPCRITWRKVREVGVKFE